MRAEIDKYCLSKLEWIKYSPGYNVPEHETMYWVVVAEYSKDKKRVNYSVAKAIYDDIDERFFLVPSIVEFETSTRRHCINVEPIDSDKVKYYTNFSVDDIEPVVPPLPTKVEEIKLNLVSNTKENRSKLKAGWYFVLDTDNRPGAGYYSKTRDEFELVGLCTNVDYFSSEGVK